MAQALVDRCKLVYNQSSVQLQQDACLVEPNPLEKNYTESD